MFSIESYSGITLNKFFIFLFKHISLYSLFFKLFLINGWIGIAEDDIYIQCIKNGVECENVGRGEI